MNIRHMLSQTFTISTWIQKYNRALLRDDLLATAVVLVLLIPQSLGYAMVAGLPPQVGLYASMLPAIIYALFGTSMSISVGPAAVPALMTLAATSVVAMPGTPEYLGAALVLTWLCGFILLAMALLRFGFLTHFISHGVISGFTTASALIIAASQLKHIFGIEAHGLTLPEIGFSLWEHRLNVSIYTLGLGGITLLLLVWLRVYLKPLLLKWGMGITQADILQRTSPMAVVVGSILVTMVFKLDTLGVKVVGDIPQGLPSIMLPNAAFSQWSALANSALLLALLIYVESISIAQSFAAKRRQRINPDKELWAIGGANIGAAITGGCPVAGSFSRSAVNFNAGAQTPMAGVFTAMGIGIMAIYFTKALYYLPLATLAATIIVAVLPMVDLKIVRHTWDYSRRDGVAILAALLMSLLLGVEVGIAVGVLLSIGFFLQRTSRPSIVVVGRVAGTAHFRDAAHHDVQIHESVLMLRVDMSLYFANASFVEEFILRQLVQNPQLKHVVLIGSGINLIDASALDVLEDMIVKLRDVGVTFHLAAIKAGVQERLERVGFMKKLARPIFPSALDAAEALWQ
ncbi:MAG: sulfate permease [Alphaproteobacteria bacterium]